MFWNMLSLVALLLGGVNLIVQAHRNQDEVNGWDDVAALMAFQLVGYACIAAGLTIAVGLK